MKVYVARDLIAPPEWRWFATAQDYDEGVPVGTGATPLAAIGDLLDRLDIEDIEPRSCTIVWST